MISKTFVEAWLQHRDTGQLPTDQHGSAFCLMIEQALAHNPDAAEVHACELQTAELWDHAIEAGKCIQSMMAAERAANPQLVAVISAAQTRAAITLDQHPTQRQLQRIGRDLAAIQRRLDDM